MEIKIRVCWPFHAVAAGPLLAGSPRPSPYVVTKRWRPSRKASGASTSCVDYEASLRILDEALASFMKLLSDESEGRLCGCGRVLEGHHYSGLLCFLKVVIGGPVPAA